MNRDEVWPDGTPCWVDVAVPDLDKGRAFYELLFGWEIESRPEFGGYCTARFENRAVCGLTATMSPEQPAAWTTYLASSDIAATVDSIGANGGTVLFGPDDVGDLGRMAICVDPAGAAFGVWQGGSHTGANVVNIAGTQTWNEIMSHSFEAEKDFYAAVFGWKLTDLSNDEMSYAVFEVEDQARGGVGNYPPAAGADAPPGWATYFGCPDTDKTVARVVELGGSVVHPPMDSPYGRMAIVSDDQGVTFCLISVADES